VIEGVRCYAFQVNTRQLERSDAALHHVFARSLHLTAILPRLLARSEPIQATTHPATYENMAEEFKRPTRFRILIIGRANAGKTTILQAVCGTEDEPVVYDEEGREVELVEIHEPISIRSTPTGPKFRFIRKIAGKLGKKVGFLGKSPGPIPSPMGGNSTPILSPSSMRGLHNLEYSLVFPSNPGFIFHDSCGFESGATHELELVRKFIRDRATKGTMDEQLHAIWYCFPTDSNRIITAAEQEFFKNIDTGRVPVIAVFTKFDALDAAAYRALEDSGIPFEQAKMGALSYAEEQFNKTHLPLIHNQAHPPRLWCT